MFSIRCYVTTESVSYSMMDCELPCLLCCRTALYSLLLTLTLMAPQTVVRAQASVPPAPELKDIVVPALRREFRGVWAATVENIDWPSKPGLSVDQQKSELLQMLDRAQGLRLNAVLLQVRPACDAMYASPLEPWSEYLTGHMGKAPDPVWDPLTYAVVEAHRRGLELHAWFNPFRARVNSTPEALARKPASADHVSNKHPEWVRQYGKLQWLDPGNKAARDHSLAVTLDVVRRYDVDGVHIDDYFYPYKITGTDGKEIDFPDEDTWGLYKAGDGKLSRSDWRRANIDDFVERMYREVKALKPWVKVGISPFGIWRPGNPPQIKGFDSYEQLYGDARRWLREGWGDYFTPQLYWPIAQTPQSYPVLLGWWLNENVKERHLWPGNFTGRAIGEQAPWPPEEVEYQIRVTRGFVGATGNIHFSAKFMAPTVTGEGVPERLLRTVYAEPALVPATPWLTKEPLPAPAASLNAEQASSPTQPGWIVRWTGKSQASWQWLVQWRASGVWQSAIVAGESAAFFIPVPSKRAPTSGTTATAPVPDVVAITAIDRLGRTSAAKLVALPVSPAALQ